MTSLPQWSAADIASYVRAIVGPTADAVHAAHQRIDSLTKPVGSLGRIEALAIRLAAIAGRAPGKLIEAKAILVAAADHGVSAEGVSAYPPAVTAQMLATFTRAAAAINACARAARADLYVVDFGATVAPAPHASLLSFRVGAGTANIARERAMPTELVDVALGYGIAAFERIARERAYDAIALGEMGIANTTSASAIIAALLGVDARQVVGRGTGIDDDRLQRKITVVEGAVARCAGADWRTVASEVGGYEIIGLAGVMLAAARHRTPIVLDGFIVAAAALLASRIAPAVIDYCIASHVSQERGHPTVLSALGLEPLLDLGLRLGEGTGAALALPLLEAASRIMFEMQTFAEAGVATSVE